MTVNIWWSVTAVMLLKVSVCRRKKSMLKFVKW